VIEVRSLLIDFKEEQPICYKVLNKAITSGKISHAYLFESNGYSKSVDLALSFAKEILCNNDKNCETCNQCQLIDDKNFPELHIIEPDGSWIKKEQLMDLQEEFSKKALSGNRKVYIITGADRLNNIAANSILKFLEEPQEGIVAILITDNRYQLLETIVSRCQLMSLRGNNYTNSKENMATIHLLGQALYRDTEELQNFLENKDNVLKLETIIKFLESNENNGLKTILYTNKYWNDLFSDKSEATKSIRCLCLLYKDILNIKLNKQINIFSDYKSKLQKIAEKGCVSDIIKKIHLINKSLQDLDFNSNVNLTIDRLIIDMAGVNNE